MTTWRHSVHTWCTEHLQKCKFLDIAPFLIRSQKAHQMINNEPVTPIQNECSISLVKQKDFFTETKVRNLLKSLGALMMSDRKKQALGRVLAW